MTATALQKLEALERFKRNPPKHKLVVPAALTPKRKAYLKAMEAIKDGVGLTLNFAISYIRNDWHGITSERSTLGSSRRCNTSEEVARNRCSFYLHILNVFFYGKQYEKSNLHIKRVAVLEKSSHWHYHLAVETPTDALTEWGKAVAADRAAFEALLIKKWNDMAGPSERAYVSARTTDEGWNRYITKFDNDICVENTRF